MFFSFSTLGLNNDLSCELIGVREDVVVELVWFDGLMCCLTLPLTLENLLGNCQVLGQATKNRTTRLLIFALCMGNMRKIQGEELLPRKTRGTKTSSEDNLNLDKIPSRRETEQPDYEYVVTWAGIVCALWPNKKRSAHRNPRSCSRQNLEGTRRRSWTRRERKENNVRSDQEKHLEQAVEESCFTHVATLRSLARRRLYDSSDRDNLR